MRFIETKLAGAFIIELEPHHDERGFFARSFCRDEFAAHGLNQNIPQTNIASNHVAGTVRGMHFQYPPAAESKLVSCIRGALLDVIVDLRPESPTWLQHVAVRLDDDSLRALYVPERFAHGYQTLADRTIASYQMGAMFAGEAAGGLRHDDPALGLEWPMPVTVMSAKDRSYPSLAEFAGQLQRGMAIG